MPSSSFFTGAPSTYWKAIAKTSSSSLPKYCLNQSLNHFSFSAPCRHGSGMSRTQSSVTTRDLVLAGSVKVRPGPLRVAVRASSVKVATTSPPSPRSTERAGFFSRSQLCSPVSLPVLDWSSGVSVTACTAGAFACSSARSS